jgi:hypothetical protein
MGYVGALHRSMKRLVLYQQIYIYVYTTKFHQIGTTCFGVFVPSSGSFYVYCVAKFILY